jgi:hypothetical protein
MIGQIYRVVQPGSGLIEQITASCCSIFGKLKLLLIPAQLILFINEQPNSGCTLVGRDIKVMKKFKIAVDLRAGNEIGHWHPPHTSATNQRYSLFLATGILRVPPDIGFDRYGKNSP